MKKLLVFTAVIAASLIATKGHSQVFINAHIGFRVPGPRVYVAPAPVYESAPVYEPAPVYQGGYYAQPAVCEAEFPGYTYYYYPAWNGHYRDRCYYEHYRPYFEREYGDCFYGRRFDRERFEHEREWHDRGRGGYEHDHEGYGRGREGWDHEHEGGDHDRGWHRERD